MTAMIDQDPSHRLRAQGQAVRLPLPVCAAVVLQPHPRFVNECSRLQRVVLSLPAKITLGDAPQLAVDTRK